ncbi:hypothetical protein ACOI22_09990 [Glaciecola sp. 2405UD65-10]|uniref:hypothetical protein n=1 Tax=Glaciecola sp. 2405UD65-10 TaxID=3397244 RepID=UPI003B5A5D12
MHYKNIVIIPAGVLCLFLLQINQALAETIQLDKDVNLIFHWGAALLLYAHISGGFIGMLAGTAASLAPKGKALHRKAGKIFYIAMFICYSIGACVAPFLEMGQRTNFVAGVLALYLLTSGVSAAQRRNFRAGIGEKLGIVVALTITLLGVFFIYLASNSPTGTIDDSPPQAFMLFVVAGSLAFIGDLRVLIGKTLTNTQRTIRHLWRMCFSFFIASGSFFFGQAGLFPDWFNASLLPLALGFFPFIILLIYLVKEIRQSHRYRHI